MPPKAQLRIFSIIFTVSLALSGCGSGGEKATEKPKDSTGAPVAGEGTTKDLIIKDGKVGIGAKAAPGDTVWVGYVGKLKDGTVFDSSEKGGGKPFAVTLGAGSVIEGWEKGLIGAQRGGKRNLVIPYRMAYGEGGHPPTIPPKADLVFDLEILEVVKQDEQDLVDATDVKVGSGAVVKEGSSVTVKYSAKLVNGVEFDSTTTQKKPYTFLVGNHDTLPGIERGVIGMKVGGKRNLRIPPKLGLPFGKSNVPPNSPIVVDVEVVKVK